MKYAIIDIGSNSVRLMLWADGKSLYKRVITTRLGKGISAGLLEEGAMMRTAEAVETLFREGRRAGAEVHAFATAAVRTAKNGGDFCALVGKKTGLAVDVVSGEREAELGLRGALMGANGSILDIGGASTEICTAEGTSLSLPIGAVRLYDACGDRRELAEGEISRVLASLEAEVISPIYAIGGTGSTLACILLGLEAYDGARIQDFAMKREDIAALTERLYALTAEERKELRGMDRARADILPGGALLLLRLMEKLRIGQVLASDRDNLEGYLFTACGLSQADGGKI